MTEKEKACVINYGIFMASRSRTSVMLFPVSNVNPEFVKSSLMKVKSYYIKYN